MNIPPRTVSATTFKAHCLALMDEVERTGQELLITKRGRVVARLSPVQPAPPALIGWMAGTVTITGDIVNPDPADAAGWERPL